MDDVVEDSSLSCILTKFSCLNKANVENRVLPILEHLLPFPEVTRVQFSLPFPMPTLFPENKGNAPS